MLNEESASSDVFSAVLLLLNVISASLSFL